MLCTDAFDSFGKLCLRIFYDVSFIKDAIEPT